MPANRRLWRAIILYNIPMETLSFAEEIRLESIHVPRAALRFAHEIAYPELDIGRYLAQLDQLAAWGQEVVAPASTAIAQAEALSGFLFERFGFRGNQADYGDPRNSYLNEVLDRRLGIPISLSVVYVHVAQAAGLAAYGIGLPGHFIVGVQEGRAAFYLDPFNGGAWLSEANLAQLVEQSTGYRGPLQAGWLQPAAPLDILERMLNNLRNIYRQRQEWPPALAVLERLRLLQPGQLEHLRDLAIAHHHGGSLRLAVDAYEQYLTRRPDAPDAAAMRRSLQDAARRLAQLN